MTVVRCAIDESLGVEMRYAHEREGNRVALAMLAGAAVGAGVALLYAPKAGAALRGDISESVGTLQGAVGERYRGLAERANGILGQAQDAAGRAAAAFEQGKRTFSQAGTRARAAATAPFERVDVSEPL